MLLDPSDARAGDLPAIVGELELLARFDRGGAEQRTDAAIATARALGLTELEQRARLVRADLLRRRGNVAEAGRIAQDVHRWAIENDSDRTVARSHFVLSAVFQEIGDVSVALEHAVRAVDALGEDADPAMRVDHLTRLADCLALNGDEAARERYTEVQRVAEDLGDVDRRLMVLNNRAYSETLWGDFAAALDFSLQLQAVADAHDVPLHIGRLDTVARTLMGLGRLEEAEAAMLPGLRPEALAASLDGDAGADFLLTLAEVRRRLGKRAAARDSLDESIRRCEQHGLTSIRVRARREQAELHAAGGEYRAAFEEHKIYVQELMDLQSAERDARARALQAMYETTEARRQTRRYRELSLRDPLTGLYNRRYVDEQLPRLLQHAADAPEVTVALLDLDYFKLVNDTCSHEVGDRVLRTVAEFLQDGESQLGDGSFAARMGGEEFLLVLVGDGPVDGRRPPGGAAPHRGRAPVVRGDRCHADHGQHRSREHRRAGAGHPGSAAAPRRPAPLPRQADRPGPRPHRRLTPRPPPRKALQLHRHRGRQLAAGLEIGRPRRAHEAQRRGDLLPAQRAGDPPDGGQCPGGVVVAVHVDAVRQADGRLEARVVDGVEEVLEGAGHVADVRRGAEQDAVGGEQVGGSGRQRGPEHEVDVVHQRDALPNRFQHGLQRGRGCVVDDEQRGHRGIIPRRRRARTRAAAPAPTSPRPCLARRRPRPRTGAAGRRQESHRR